MTLLVVNHIKVPSLEGDSGGLIGVHILSKN
jgi:hypothetical protein